MSSRAVTMELLEQRIAENRASQQIDLGEWIFDRLVIHPKDKILELCCGTGAQSIRFAERLTETGSLTAVDISAESLRMLVSKLAPEDVNKVRAVQASIDDLAVALHKLGEPSFDLIFCAYGLYYSKGATALLDQIRSWLRPGGRIAIVGPFGLNNSQLFDLVRKSGATLTPAVLTSSQSFMLETVVPWATVNFESVRLHSMVNPVRWASQERVLNYWQNTTFYDDAARPKFERLLQEHFREHSEFVNEKWVMMVEMTNARG